MALAKGIKLLNAFTSKYPGLSIFDTEKLVDAVGDMRQGDILSEVKSTEEIKGMCKSIFDDVVTEEAEKLIIFIDELDRCRPTYAVEMLERIKHYFDDERIIFVFSVNREQLAHTISSCYGSNFDAEKYLNRFFDFCFELPTLDIQASLQSLGYTRSGTYLSCISAELQSYYGLKLRDAISYTSKMEGISDKVQKECSSGKDVMMILLIVPVICVLDFVSATQKNQILNGNGWDILESIISNCPNHYANCVGQLASDYRQGQDSDISKSKDLFRKYYEQPVHSASDGQRDESVSPEKQMGKELKRAEREVSQSMDEPEEDDFDFSDEDVSEEESRAEEKAAGDGFRGVTEEDEIPFSGDEEETQEDEAESEDDKVEKAKAVVCNFGYFQGRTLGEMLETPKGWESLKWIVTRYKGANTQMKEAATILVEADAYMPKAA